MKAAPDRDQLLRLLGSSRGVVVGFAPRTRIIAGSLLLLSCLVSDARTEAGLVVVVLTVFVWLGAAGPPVRLVARLSLLGTAMFAPLLLLTPFVDGNAVGRTGLAVTLAVFAKGVSSMLVATITTSTLTLVQLHEGLSTLPMPRFLSGIIVQIVLQAGMLGRETSRISEAMAVRRATSGLIAGVVTLAGVSSVWLLRLLMKVERVASAMEIRGFDGTETPGETCKPGAWDAITTLLALAWTLGAVGMRLCSLS